MQVPQPLELLHLIAPLTRLYVEVTCPQCHKVFVDIPALELLRTCET